MENQFGKISKLNLEAEYKDGRTVLSEIGRASCRERV